MARPRLHAALGGLIHDLWALALSQPVRPVYRALRGRSRCRDGAAPVVFVHGYGQNGATFWWLARSLAARGLGPAYYFDYDWLADIRKSGADLARYVETVAEKHGCERVDVVAHSMGGLVVFECLRQRSDARIRRCVTLGTPHRGVTWRGPIWGRCGAQVRAGCRYLRELSRHAIRVPTLSIGSTHDTIVPAARTSIRGRGGRDYVIRRVGHLGMLFSGEVAELVANHLDGSSDRGLKPLAKCEPVARMLPVAPPSAAAESWERVARALAHRRVA